MSRRLEVELTSKRDDGRWTWRAAGAKQPKGELDAALLYEGAKTGDVVRVEAEFEIEGIVVTAVLPPQAKKRSEPERVEIVGPPRDERGVISSVIAKSEGGRPPRRGTPGQDGQGPRARHDSGGREQAGRPRPDARRPRPDDAAAGPARSPRPPRPETPAPTPRPKRLNPGHAHRQAVLESLPPEQRPIAEQALRGGLPGVRHAVEAQNAELRAKGEPEVSAQALLAIAEQLLPSLKAADWRDRAEAAAKMLEDLSIRDLRSVVTGSETARDDDGRLLAGTLREALERRLKEHRESWMAEIVAALEDGRLVRALRVSARAPDPGTRFPAELAVRLSEAAGLAMASDAPADRWQALLEAVLESPVRRSVKPAGLPVDAPDSVLQLARQASGKVPALAPLLGISMPPPPGPPRPLRPGSVPGRRRGPNGATRAPIPPPPPPPQAPPAPAPTENAGTTP